MTNKRLAWDVKIPDATEILSPSDVLITYFGERVPIMSNSMRGRIYSGYRVIDRLGRVTFKAERDGQFFALKMIQSSVALHEEARQRLLREIQILRQVQQHEYIISIADVLTVDDTTILVMPFVEGGTLRDIINARNISQETKLRLLQQVSYAVDYLHRQGIWHRDLKPENVLVEQLSDGHMRAAVSDFGIAYLEYAASLTQTRTRLGTPAYMAPEMWDTTFGKIDARVDIYALGIMAYEIIVGERPFHGETDGQFYSSHCYKPVPTDMLRKLAPSSSVTEVILSALQKKPDERVASASQFGDRLLTAHATGSWQRKLAAAEQRRERLNLWIGVAALILAIIGVIFGYLEIRGEGSAASNGISAATSATIAVAQDNPEDTATFTQAPPTATFTDLPLTKIALTDEVQTATQFAFETQTATNRPPTSTPTPTPTIDEVATLQAIRTEIALSWTPSNTPTPSETNTPTSTATETASNTPTPTPTQSPLELAQMGVENNDDWEPYIQDFDGVPMALVPVGCFEMGSENGNSDEQPVHTQCIEKPFWIDVYEVTNELYGSTGCTNWSSEPDQPRNCVDWFDAQAFCEARGARLPTEAEWEYAARGPDSLIYPWGNVYDAALVIGADDPTYGDTETAPVGSRPGGASWVGALDMSGNVWEWTSSLYEDYPYDRADGREADTGNRTDVRRVLRGGSFGPTASFLRSADRLRGAPDAGLDLSGVGLRCARSIN